MRMSLRMPARVPALPLKGSYGALFSQKGGRSIATSVRLRNNLTNGKGRYLQQAGRGRAETLRVCFNQCTGPGDTLLASSTTAEIIR